MTAGVEYKVSPHRPPGSARALAEAHPCAVETCPTPCSPGHVACRRHWRQIPQSERDPLIAAFQRRLSDPVAFVLARGLTAQLASHYARLLDD